MNEFFVKSIYKSLVEENKDIYIDLFASNIDKVSDEYWKKSLNFYNSLSQENKDILIDIIEQIMIDTISNILGIVDGSSTLDGFDAETKLFLDSNDTDGELQDLFLEYVEQIKE